MTDIGFRIRYEFGRYKYLKKRSKNKGMKVNIIYNEAGWIIHKFALSVCDELTKMGIEATVSEKYDASADINHYFFPNHAPVANPQVTFMVTHVDSAEKLSLIQNQTDKGAIGVCMSRETRDRLISSGVRPDRLCYINPAQDGMLKPRKVKLGFTNRVYNDSRKREEMILDVCKKIDSDIFEFDIMGTGWESIVSELKTMGFDINYFPEFDKAKYNELIKNLDYYCYFGFDEGSMGFLDALAAGIDTIVTPQGYHLDEGIDITYPVRTIDDITNVLLEIQKKKYKAIEFAQKSTWANYTKKHLEIWKYMLNHNDAGEILKTRGWYVDGIYSLLLK